MEEEGLSISDTDPQQNSFYTEESLKLSIHRNLTPANLPRSKSTTEGKTI